MEELRSETIQLFKEDHAHAMQMLGRLEEDLEQLQRRGNVGILGESLGKFSVFLEEALKVHFRQEEVALFPVMIEVEKNAAQPVEAMLKEHSIIEAAHRRLREELKKPTPSPDVVKENGEEIIQVLTGHIQREDHALFPFALRILSEERLEEVERRRRQMDVD